MISSDIKLLFDDLDELSATVEPTATAETVKGVEGWLQVALFFKKEFASR